MTRRAVEDRPAICILDGSAGPTGALAAARTMAVLLASEARVTLVLPAGAEVPAAALAPFAAVRRLPIVPLRRSVRAAALHLPALVAAAVALRRQLARDGATVLVVNDVYLMEGVLCRLLGFRGTLVTVVRMDPRRFPLVLARLWCGLAALASTRLVAVSGFVAGRLPRGIAAEVLHDALPPGTPPPRSRGEGGPRRLVAIANYTEGKGQDDALAAFARIAPLHPDLTLEFHGGDLGRARNRAWRAELAARAAALGLGGRVAFHGFAEDPAAVLAGAYAALVLSRSEGFSLTCLEACAAGVPVIAARSGGPQEIVRDGATGLLVPPGDPAAAAAAIARLAGDPALAARLGAEAARHVRRSFGPERARPALRAVLGLRPPRPDPMPAARTVPT